MSEQKIMLGNEAIARGAYEAGVKVSSAYPGTPSTEISENIVKYPEIYAEWAPNEKVAMEVAIGASISGVRAMASMKMVGVNVASDPLYTVSYIGANGGLVLPNPVFNDCHAQLHKNSFCLHRQKIIIRREKIYVTWLYTSQNNPLY